MSSNYDNWERLVAAVLDRVELRRLALLSSRETSFNSSISSAFNISPYNSQFITVLDYVPGSVTDRVIKAAGNTVIFKQECLEIKSKAQKLAGMLRQAASTRNELYNRPALRIVSDTELVLEKALKLVMKCSRQGMKRIFNIIPAQDFRKMASLLENSIEDVSWLISISNSEANAELRMPPITISEPILCLVWKQITTLHMGSMDDRSNAAASLASLAHGNDQHGKLIVEEGGVGPLLKLVEEGNLERQENASRAIGWLVNNPENMQHMIDAGAPQLFVKMLKEGPMKVQADVAWAISELAMHHPMCRNLFAQHDIIVVLVGHLAFETVHEVVTSNRARVMECPITKAHMKEMAARALSQLAKGNSPICLGIMEPEALPCFLVLSEEGSEEVRYNSAMASMVITAMAEEDVELRRASFNPNSSVTSLVLDQLRKVLVADKILNLSIPCIKAIGNLAKIFKKTETRIIRALVKLMCLQNINVSTEACIALTKFACSENPWCFHHSKAIIDAGGAHYLISNLYSQGAENVQNCDMILLCYIAMHVPETELFGWKVLHDELEIACNRSSLRRDKNLEKLWPEAKRRLDLHHSRGYC